MDTGKGLRGWRALVSASFLGVGLVAGATPPPDAARLAYLLEYVGTDYERGVRDGAVVDQNEYGEVLRLTREVIAAYGPRPGRLGRRLTDLEALIVRRAPAAEVLAATRELGPKLLRALRVTAAAPSMVPDLADGRRVYRRICADCHGPTGNGDGRDASGLAPPPTAFRGDYLERLSPRQIFHAASFGVEGTGMASFAGVLSPEERWNVAFFVPTLRVEFAPKRPAVPPRIPLGTLAASSNEELLARLRATRPDASAGEVDWLRTTFVSPEGTVVPFAGPGASRHEGIAAALDLQDAFASVAERMAPRLAGLTSWVRDPAWEPTKLQAARGDQWIAQNQDALRYPGFKPLRSGSALLVDDEGYLLSADHLVRVSGERFADLIEVEIDGAYLAAAVVGAEPTLDLVVLALAEPGRAAKRAPLELGDSDRLEPGHWVVALGDPPGPEQTVAVGVVASRAQRQCYQAELSATMLQTSLAVPPGGLGGPVVDILGNVVGLSVRPAAPGLDAVAPPAVARTLPVNLVMNLYEALKAARSTRSPWIGVSVLELPLARKRLGESAAAVAFPPTGVYVDDVFSPSPASRAGVRPGDFLVGLGGHPVLAVGDFQRWLYVGGIGTQVELELVRAGTTKRLTVAIEVRPPSATTK